MIGYALIKKSLVKDDPLAVHVESIEIIRTYSDSDRAIEDIDLLRKCGSVAYVFELVEVEHVA